MKYRRIMRFTIGQPGERGRVLESVQASGEVGLRLGVTVRRAVGEAPQVECRAWGVSESTLSALQQPGAACVVAAGYGSSPLTIAAGRIIPGTLDDQRDGRLWAPVWRVSDGPLALSDVRLSKAWDQTDSAELLDYVITQANLTRGKVQPAKVVQYRRGYVMSASARAVLAALMEDTGSRSEIVGGTLNVWGTGGVLQERRAVISTDTGLLSTERADEGRWSVRTLLEPSVRPGDTVRVDSTRYRGTLRAVDVSHDLDSGYDASYYTTIIGVPA